MAEVISETLVQERIDLYIENNRDTILEMIDKKIETKVKESIKDVFSYRSRWDKTEASKSIDAKIEEEINLQANNISIDTEWIKLQIEKKVKTAIKNLTVKLD